MSIGWTPTQRDYRTPYGVIHYGGRCKDDYANMVTYDQGGSHTILRLQRPAMKAFWGAQVRLAKRLGWSAARIKANPKGRFILILPGTNRTCAMQAALRRLDPNRYASPAITGHTRGLAIDVRQDQSNLKLINTALIAEGWNRVRPDDEPWHYSFHVSI